jgi:precorrin-6A/cobalt-precorrin-6A reductase
MARGSPLRVLILGGTAEASALARLVAAVDWIAPVLSFAGRTVAPVLPPIPSRIGGFGGAEGLAAYLGAEAIDLLIDATHPFAHQISINAERAAAATGTPRLMLQRPPWVAQPGDNWQAVPTVAAAAAALCEGPRQVFLTIGRQDLLPFAEIAPQHSYLIRSVDPPDHSLLPPRAAILTGRGPFDEAEEHALLARHGIGVLVTKNSGGSDGKLRAARALDLPVIMVDRKPAPPGETVAEPAQALAWLRDHADTFEAARGA